MNFQSPEQSLNRGLDTDKTTGKTEGGNEKAPQIKTLWVGLAQVNYKESHFEFPERLVKETGGVKGYVRKEFEYEELSKKLRKQIDSKNLKESSPTINMVIEKLCPEFLSTTNLHEMGAVWDVGSEDREKFKQSIFKQRVFSPDLKSVHDPRAMEMGLGFTAVSTDTGKRVERVENEAFPDELNTVFYKDQTEEVKSADEIVQGLREKHIAVMPRRSLSVFNVDKNHGLDPKSITWGFNKKNLAYKKYLESTRKFLQKIQSTQFGGNKEENYHLWTTEAGYGQPGIFEYEMFTHDLLGDGVYSPDHPYIPVVIGHPDIPDLRWCHAAYGYIPTEKGFSILEFVT